MSYTEKENKKIYYLKNKDKILEYGQQYRENNKESISNKNKEYYEKTKDIKKEYYEVNKEEILKHNKEYRENNKEKIKNYASEKIMCSCGCEVRRDKITKHQTTKKHKNKNSL